MARDAEATKKRLLDAATEEFATHGLAGGRVDRIAAAANANKNLIYIYFGDKEKLFDTVFEQAVAGYLAQVEFTPHDLPGYAAAMFDYYIAHPEMLTLSRWYSLERSESQSELPLIAATARDRLAQIKKAQAAGLVNSSLSAQHLWDLLRSLAGTWGAGSPEPVPATATKRQINARRQALIQAVERLTRP